MAEATVRSQVSQDLTLSEDENSSTFSQTRVTSGNMADKKKVANVKSKSGTKPKASAKMEDLTLLENKITTEINAKFSSLDGRIEQLIGLLDKSGSVQQRPSVNFEVDDSTSGACEPQETARLDTSGVQRPLISLENSLDKDFGIPSHSLEDDMISLQPGQRERQNLGLLSSEEGDRSTCNEPNHSDQVETSRFGKYTSSIQTSANKENEPLTHETLVEMFGDDAQSDSSSLSKGLYLDKAQIEILNNSWRCKFPDKLSAYREASKQSFPISESAEKVLQVPSLDDLSERLLIKKHGRKAAFGSSQSLFAQPYKSMEKIAFQGQMAARLGIISLCYTQQALGLLLSNLKKDTPNLDEAVQNVRDIFAMSTKSLDQVARAGAFHHLIRRKATVADTGLHEYKDLQKTALTAPLSGEGVFGPEFEKKLKDRQEKDKQLSDLMPEFSKKFYKRKNPYPSESSTQKKSRQSEDTYKPRSNFSSNYRRPARGGSYSSNNRNNSYSTSKNFTSVSSFRPQGEKSNKS